MPKTTATQTDVLAALIEGHKHQASPSGSYERILVGNKAAAWVLPLKKGGCRLILRTGADSNPPKAEGMWRESTGDPQLRVTADTVAMGRSWIDYAVKLVTVTAKAEASVAVAHPKAKSPAKKTNRTRKPTLSVVKNDD
jgi:hypothetical protein